MDYRVADDYSWPRLWPKLSWFVKLPLIDRNVLLQMSTLRIHSDFKELFNASIWPSFASKSKQDIKAVSCELKKKEREDRHLGHVYLETKNILIFYSKSWTVRVFWHWLSISDKETKKFDEVFDFPQFHKKWHFGKFLNEISGQETQFWTFYVRVLK